MIDKKPNQVELDKVPLTARDVAFWFLQNLRGDQWDEVPEMVHHYGFSMSEIESCLTSISVGAGKLAYYIGHRSGFGFGDHSHEESMKAAEKRQKVLRKANGYTKP